MRPSTGFLSEEKGREDVMDDDLSFRPTYLSCSSAIDTLARSSWEILG